MLDRLPSGEAADAEIGDLVAGRAVDGPCHQDVGRLQVAVDDRRVELVRGGDDLGELADDPGRLRRGGTLAVAMPLLDQAGQVAPVDIFVDQAGRLGAQVRVEQADDPRDLARPHQAVEQVDLVAEQQRGRRVVAKLDGHRRSATLIDVAGHPDLAEAAGAEEPLQLPVEPGGTVAGLEAGVPRREDADQLLGRARNQGGRDGRARGVALPPERGPGRGWYHREIADDELTDRLGLVGGEFLHDLGREIGGLAVRDQEHGLDLVPPLGLGPRAGPGRPDVPADLRQDVDQEVPDRQPPRGRVDDGLGHEVKHAFGERMAPPGRPWTQVARLFAARRSALSGITRTIAIGPHRVSPGFSSDRSRTGRAIPPRRTPAPLDRAGRPTRRDDPKSSCNWAQ